MTLFTKPEVHNIFQRSEMKTEPRPQATSAEKLTRFRRLIPEIAYAHVQTHTDRPVLTLLHF